jgi:predicted regulator of Ras-like GTPase activity (Roadblock/LC7/MglB family)
VIDAYATPEGDDEHNLLLSQRRARRLRDYLVDHGVAPDRNRRHRGAALSTPTAASPWSSSRPRRDRGRRAPHRDRRAGVLHGRPRVRAPGTPRLVRRARRRRRGASAARRHRPRPSLPVGPTAAELELRARLEAAAHELHALRLLAGRGRLTLPPLDADALPALQHFTEQAGKSPGMTSLVVADDLGLLVAGTSPRADELAALGGFLVGAGDRVRNLAALGPLARVMVEDTRGATASVTPLPGTDLVAVAVQEPLGGQPA